jgi:glycosyltransferase involved in cell wall biosynthesis
MSCGLPIIATNVGGIPEQIQDGENGFLVPVKHPEEIAEAALKLNTDPNLRSQMSENARNTVLQRYTKDKVLQQYIDVYNELI